MQQVRRVCDIELFQLAGEELFALQKQLHYYLNIIQSMLVKIVVAKPLMNTTAVVECDLKNYTIPIPIQPFAPFALASKIIFPSNTLTLLQVLTKQINEVPSLASFYTLQDQCQHHFNISIDLDYHLLAQDVLFADKTALQLLDQLTQQDILKLFTKAYNNFPQQTHSKLHRRFNKYLAITNRTPLQKQQLQKLLQAIKQQSSDDENQKKPPQKEQLIQSQVQIQRDGVEKDKKKTSRRENQDKAREKGKAEQNQNEAQWQDLDNEDTNNTKQRKQQRAEQRKYNDIEQSDKFSKKQAPIDKHQKRSNNENGNGNGKNKNRQNRRNYGDNKDRASEGKEKDIRVLLGLNGDSDQGWRERNRVVIKPEVDEKMGKKGKNYSQGQKKHENKHEKAEVKQNLATISPQAVKPDIKQEMVIDEVKQQNKQIKHDESKVDDLHCTYSFPEQQKGFLLQVDKQYDLLVNNQFWIKLQKNNMIIEKDGKGFIRSGKYLSNKEDILMAEGVTLTLDGSSSLQDGGETFNAPNVADFVGSKGYFIIKSLKVYPKD